MIDFENLTIVGAMLGLGLTGVIALFGLGISSAIDLFKSFGGVR